MSWELHSELLRVSDRFGAFWALLGLFALGYACFAPLIRASVATVFVLVATQMWFAPLYLLSRALRWWMLLILAVRGIKMMASTQAVQDESRGAHRVVGGLALLAILSIIWSDSPDPRYNLQIAASFAMGVLLTFGMLWRLLDQVDVLAVFAKAVTAFAFVIFTTGWILQFAAEYFNITQILQASTKAGRWAGLFYNPNMAGLFGATLLPIVVASPREYLGKVARLRWITVLAIVATIFMSGSRSAVIGSGFAFLFLGLQRFGASAFVSVTVTAVALAILLVWAPIEDVDATVVGHITRTNRLQTLSGRVELWEIGWKAVQHNPLFGLGWGESRFLGGGHHSRALAAISGRVVFGSNLHSAHMQLLVDLGFLGLGLFWIFCGMILSASWTLLRAPPVGRNLLTTVICASLLAMLGDTFVHGSVFSIGGPGGLVFWAFSVMVMKEVGRIRRDDAAAAEPVRVPGTSPPALYAPAGA